MPGCSLNPTFRGRGKFTDMDPHAFLCVGVEHFVERARISPHAPGLMALDREEIKSVAVVFEFLNVSQSATQVGGTCGIKPRRIAETVLQMGISHAAAPRDWLSC